MNYVVTAILGFVLYLTNPTSDDFNLYVRQTIQSRVTDENPFYKLIIAGVVSEVVKEGTYRKDYIVFSVFTVDTSVLNAFNADVPPKLEFVGIARNFIPLRKF
ncbi:MAG: DUF4359 domain-containing protein [Actinobacteria bacterium]|nr:DUF4359 domain-containing protein [Actinomycetota bacterium]